MFVLSPLVNTRLDGSTYKTSPTTQNNRVHYTYYWGSYSASYFVVAVGLTLIRRHLYNNASLLLLYKHTEYVQNCGLYPEGRKYFVSLNHAKATSLFHRFCVCEVQKKSFMFQLFVVFLSYLFPLCDVCSLEVHMEATLAIVYLISFGEIDPGKPIQY